MQGVFRLVVLFFLFTGSVFAEESTEVRWTGNEERIPYSVFRDHVFKDEIQSVFLSASPGELNEARIVLKKDSLRKVVMLPTRRDDNVWEYLYKGETNVEVLKNFVTEQPNSVTGVSAWVAKILGFFSLLLNTAGFLFIFILLIVVLVLIQIKSMRWITGGPKKQIRPESITVSFKDIAGIDEAKAEVREVVDFLNNKSSFNRLGAKIPRGVLLVGSPGNGKTMLAKAVAKETNATFFQASGSEFVEMYVGLGASRLRDLFKAARKEKKAIIFIDEIDALGKKRGGPQSNSESEQTLNQLLVEMDGFDSNADVIVIAATNRLEVLDEALLRPGRFDRHITVHKPSQRGREEILKVYLNQATLVSTDVDLASIAKQTVGFSGADLSNLVNEALIRAAKFGKTSLGQEDLQQAREKLLLGDHRMDIDIIEKERVLTAVHEAGHAIMALACSEDPLEKVTILPRREALGVTLQIPERENLSWSKQALESKIKVLMGGRAAEELVFKEVTTGASNDMAVAFDLAKKMVSFWGMGDVLGPSGIQDWQWTSDGLKVSLEKEASEKVLTQYQIAVKVLNKYRLILDAMTKALLENDTLSRVDIEKIWEEGKGPPPRWIKGKGLPKKRSVSRVKKAAVIQEGDSA